MPACGETRPADAHDEADILFEPLDQERRLDPRKGIWRHASCRVRRFGQEEDQSADETGFRRGEERFVAKEHASICDRALTHTRQVARVESP